MTSIVITGSTRGIGRGLAQSLLEQSSKTRVIISGRTADAVERAVEELARDFDADRLGGQPCEVGDPAQVQELWDAAVARFGGVDIWINNAGVANATRPFAALPFADMESVVRTNVLGVMYGSKVAIAGMNEQADGGTVFNMEGLGSDGRSVPGLLLYGSTKYALRYLTRGLVDEARGSRVRVCSLSPGMVVTELLTRELERMSEAERARTLRIFNILADRVDTVTPWLAARILAGPPSGARIAWLSGLKVAARFALAPFRKRDLFGSLPGSDE